MRNFLAMINASIEIDDFRPPKLQRLHDCVIMDVVLESGEFTDAEIRRINYFRLYLRAETLSDLTNVAGTSLDLNKLKGQWSLQSSRHHENAIYQERPEGAAWTIQRSTRTFNFRNSSQPATFVIYIQLTQLNQPTSARLTGGSISYSAAGRLARTF